MATVSFQEASRIYPKADRPAVDALDLEIADGEFLVLVGPSGCGKSTSLRMLAGLEEVDSGSVLIGNRDVTDQPPKERDIAMVFQNYALYPHMTVGENMGFALKLAGVKKTEIATRCRCPPDNALGLRSRYGSRSRIFAASWTRAAISLFPTPAILSAKPMLSATVMCGYRA